MSPGHRGSSDAGSRIAREADSPSPPGRLPSARMREYPTFWGGLLPVDVADRAARIWVICALVPAWRHAAAMLGRVDERAFFIRFMPVTWIFGCCPGGVAAVGRGQPLEHSVLTGDPRARTTSDDCTRTDH